MKKLTAILLILIVSFGALFADDLFMEGWKFGAEYQPVQGTYGATVEVAPVGNVAAYGAVGINDAYGKLGIIIHPRGHAIGFFVGGGARALKTYTVTTKSGTVDVDGTVEVTTESTGTISVPFLWFILDGETSSTGSGTGTFEGSGDFTYEDLSYTGLTFQGIAEAGLHVNMGRFSSAKLGVGWYGESWGSNLTFAIGY